jgi:hypothetical protein
MSTGNIVVKKLPVDTFYLTKVDVPPLKSRFDGAIQPFFDDNLRPTHVENNVPGVDLLTPAVPLEAEVVRNQPVSCSHRMASSRNHRPAYASPRQEPACRHTSFPRRKRTVHS